MCDPTTIALTGLGLGIAGDIMDSHAQNDASKKNERAAKEAAKVDIGAINLREAQENRAAMQQIEEADRQTKTVVGQAHVSAAEAGVSGNSVDALMQQIQAQGSLLKSDIGLNKNNTISQLEREKAGIAATAQSRINAVPRANPFATALRIGGRVVSTAGQLQQRKPV